MRKNKDETTFYQIIVKGHLPSNWSDWFDGSTITNEPGGYCQIAGEVVDQSALHSILQRIRDLGLTLISVNPIITVQKVEEDTNEPGEG